MNSVQTNASSNQEDAANCFTDVLKLWNQLFSSRGGRVEAWLNLQSNISYDFKCGHFWKTFCFLCLQSCCSESSNAGIRSCATAAKLQTLTVILRRSLDQLKKKEKKSGCQWSFLAFNMTTSAASLGWKTSFFGVFHNPWSRFLLRQHTQRKAFLLLEASALELSRPWVVWYCFN